MNASVYQCDVATNITHYLTEIRSTEYHTEYKSDIPEIDTETQVGLTSTLIVILGMTTAILLIIMLFCIFRPNRKLFSNKNSESLPSLESVHSSNKDSKVSQSCIPTQSLYSEYQSMITQTNDHRESSLESEMELRTFIVNSEVVYGYLKLPPPEYRTARSKRERKCPSDRHSI